MEEAPNTSTGLVHAFRRLLDTFVALAESRLELATVEAKEERARAIVIVVLTAVMFFAGTMAVLLLTALGVYLCRANLKLALAGFALAYAGISFLVWRVLRRELQKPFFGETLGQLKKDRAWLIPRQ